MKYIRNKGIEALLFMMVMLLIAGCSVPSSEEFQLGEERLHIAVLPFKKESKYITYDLNNGANNADFIGRIKDVHDILDLEKLGDREYTLIDSIEQFDSNYKAGQLYFIIVKSFIKKDGSLKFIYVENFDEKVF